MGLKKYEIITVGSSKRVRALRSWAVGDRYVNIGDVGGIVYDEKTLSQDGLCWLFRGNFGFPGARIGGDSIVDVVETTLSAAGAPNVDILGSSVVVGSRLLFDVDRTGTDAVVLTAADFEQGGFNALIAGNPITGSSSTTYIRLKNPIFAGGKPVTLKCGVPGYSVTAVALDRDGLIIANAPTTATGVGVAITVPAGQYFSLMMAKDPIAATVPADATAAQITFTGTYETSLSIIDSRLEVGPVNIAGSVYIRPGGTYTIASGAKYPEMIIRNSKVSINLTAAVNKIVRLMGQIIGSTATIYSTDNIITMAGLYSNIKNLTASGAGAVSATYDSIQATDCDNFAVSPTVFPEMAAAQAANTPFIFQGCNVPDGRFYHHAQIANTYKNVDFAKAQADLGKALANAGITLVSSEVEGMYRLYANGFGALVESHDSVKSLNIASANLPTSYGTTIYKDAYLNGLFDLAGTNVFGNKVRSHPMARVLNAQPRAVQGIFNTITVGGTITGVTANANRVCVPIPFRVNGSKGLTINCPTGVEGSIVLTDINGVIKGLTALATGESSVPAAQLVTTNAYIFFRKTGDAAITPADLAGVTVTTYNGCKIVNTGEAAIPMKGNNRVEDNATLVNAIVVGSGYFGGNCVAYMLSINGSVFMKDNAKFTKTGGYSIIRNLKMTENAYAKVGNSDLNGNIHLSDNARFTPRSAGLPGGDLVMKDNAVVSGAVAVYGVITMKDNAKVNVGTTLNATGDITLCGSYNQTINKSWTGKRVIDSVDAPTYDNNVKTQYDF